MLPLVMFVIFIVIVILGNAIKILREYERGVIFRLGRYTGTKGPGLFVIIPFIDKMVRVSLRIISFDVNPQEVITKDNVPVKVNAVVYYRVIEPDKSIIAVENYHMATLQISQTTLRGVVGQSELDELLAAREKINQKLQKVIDEQTDPWGIKVSTVEIKEVEIPDNMKRAMARQAETERERRAKIINAQGEFQAAEKLAQAAEIINKQPAALQLRFLQTLSEIAAEHNSTIVFPLPMELITPFLETWKKVK
ncbi:MAG TPA: slipin family protein [Candidatus Omnitrophica bacterium]|nr:slipin family protein [Candidatus Omnitrophota bacterium]